MTTFRNGKLQLFLGLCCAAMACSPGLASAFSVDSVFATNGTTGIADDFGDGVLDPAWTVLSGSPTEAGGFLRIADGDSVLRSTGPLSPGAVILAEFDLTELSPGEFGGLMVTGSDASDVFTVNFTTAGIFVADETGLLGGVAGAPGAAASVQLLAVGTDAILTVNGSPVYAGTSGLSAFVTGAGFFLVPEPASAVLALLGLFVVRPRRG